MPEAGPDFRTGAPPRLYAEAGKSKGCSDGPKGIGRGRSITEWHRTTMVNSHDPLNALEALLTAFETLDFDTVAMLLDDNAVFEFPFSHGDRRQEGKARILAYLNEAMASFVRSMKFKIIEVHPCVETDRVIAEYESEGVRVDGRAYANRYIAVLKVASGRIVLFREFFNPSAITPGADN